MEPKNQTFQELIGNGVKYIVPRFQRDYAWNQEQWEDLWADIETLKYEYYHYMGYIVLKQIDKHDFEIIDGQQRLITLSLVIMAAIKQIQNLIDEEINVKDNEERIAVLKDRFIGSKNPISLSVDSKLSLNRNNNTHFRYICSNLKISNTRGLTKTNKLINLAFKFFEVKSMGSTGSELAKFIEELSTGMIFTKIVVQDDINAYKIFETLNARGVQLSTPDLLKNYIFSIVTKNNDVPDNDLDDLDEQWAGIISQLGESNFTDFIRYHHNFQENLITKKALFKSVRSLADTPKKAINYLKSLTEFSPLYASLLNPSDAWWRNLADNTYLDSLPYLEGLRLFNIKQPLTVLMIAFNKFSSKEFCKTIKYLYVLSIRYNVICHLSPNEQEKLYNKMAVNIFKGEYKRASHIKNGTEFKKLYPDDNTFLSSFQYHKMPSRQSPKKIKYLLAQIEAHLGNKADYTKVVLEHVCPYNPDEHWYEYFGENIHDIHDRLGNMLILDKDELKRNDFATKKEYYSNLNFKLAQKISTYSKWNIENVNDYQKWLAENAVQTWRVD